MQKFANKIKVDKKALDIKAKKPTSPKGNSTNGPSAGGGGLDTVFNFSGSSSAGGGGTPSLNPSDFVFTKVAINNCGNSCYFNTAIQQLIHSPVFIDFLKNMDSKIQMSDKDNNIISLLLGIYDSMKTATSPIESEVIYNQIQALPQSKIANIMNGNQQDIDNFMNYLFEDIEKAIFKYTSQNIIQNILTFLNTFANNIITKKTCSKCKYITIKYEYSSKCEILKILNQSDTDAFNAKLIKLQTDLNNEIDEQKKNGNKDSGPIRNKYRETFNSPSELKSGKQVIVGTKANDADFLNMETIINNSKLSENLESECKNCCESTQRPSDVITNKTPNLLKFYINRNHYTNDGNNIKLNDSIGNITQPLTINTKIYNLINAAIHKNYSAVGGHYAALCKNVIDKEWNIFNDEIVSKQEVKDNDKNEEYNNYNSSMNFFIYETNNIDEYNAVDLFIYLFLQNEYREFLLTEPYKSYFTKNKEELKNFKDMNVNNTILHIVCDNADNFVSENVIIDIYNFLVHTIKCDVNAINNNGETPFMLASNSPLSPLFINLIQNATAETLLKSNTKNNKTPVDKINCDLNKEISKFSVDNKENLFNVFFDKKNKYDEQMQKYNRPNDTTIKNVVESGNTALILFRKIENFFENSRNIKDKQNKYLFSEKLQQFNKCINQKTKITDYFKNFNFLSVNNTFFPDRITLFSLINSCKNIIKICYESSQTDIDWLKRIPEDFTKDLNPSVGVKNTVTSNTSTASKTATGNATSNTKKASKTATSNTKVITGQNLPPPPPVSTSTATSASTSTTTGNAPNLYLPQPQPQPVASTPIPTSNTAPIFIKVKFKGIEIQGNVEILETPPTSPISLSNCITELTSTPIDASVQKTFVIKLDQPEIEAMNKLVADILTTSQTI
jgi:hypothetical protein